MPDMPAMPQQSAHLPEPAHNGQGSSRTDVAREFQNLLVDIEDLVKSATSLTGDELARAKNNLFARLAAARASVEQAGRAVAQKARQGAKATDDYVHESPWTAIGAVAATSLLLGWLLGRRR